MLIIAEHFGSFILKRYLRSERCEMKTLCDIFLGVLNHVLGNATAAVSKLLQAELMAHVAFAFPFSFTDDVSVVLALLCRTQPGCLSKQLPREKKNWTQQPTEL